MYSLQRTSPPASQRRASLISIADLNQPIPSTLTAASDQTTKLIRTPIILLFYPSFRFRASRENEVHFRARRLTTLGYAYFY